MTTFNKFLKNQLADHDFKSEYDALEPEFSIIQTIIDIRKSASITQKKCSEITGISQGDISKLESGNANPSLRTLQRLTAGMGKKVKIAFV